MQREVVWAKNSTSFRKSSDKPLGIISMTRDWGGSKDAQRISLTLWRPMQPSWTPMLFKVPPAPFSQGVALLYCSAHTLRNRVLMDIESISKGSDTIHIGPTWSLVSDVFPHEMPWAIAYDLLCLFIFQVVPIKKLRLFFRDREALPCIRVAGPMVPLTLLTRCLY